jgi:hypothetical protein
MAARARTAGQAASRGRGAIDAIPGPRYAGPVTPSTAGRGALRTLAWGLRPVGWAILACGLLGSACAPSAAALQKALGESAGELTEGVRWRRHGDVSSRLAPALRDRFYKQAEVADEALTISETELMRADFSDQSRRAALRYRYEWFTPRESLLRKTFLVFRWRYQDKGWYVESIEHSTGPRFPLFEGLAPGSGPKPPRARP